VKSVKNISSRLKLVPFESIFEYLDWIEKIAQLVLRPLGSRAVVVSAAAVSDFYLDEIPVDKIQSNGSQGLTIVLKPTPKLLGHFKQKWCPDAKIVGFKLETDERLLKTKCLESLKNYSLDLVIGNLLPTRYSHVYLARPASTELEPLTGNGLEASLVKIILEYILISYNSCINDHSS
jgi:phosphopantothenate-cysteine ligase